MKFVALLFLALVISTAASAEVRLLVAGLEGDEFAALVEVWPEAEPLPAELPWDAPYPRFMPLLDEGPTLLVVAVKSGPAGWAVSGRLLGRGGYDERLGTVHIAPEPSSLAAAVGRFLERAEALFAPTTGTDSVGAPVRGPGEIAGRLEKIFGLGLAPATGLDEEERRRVRMRAYHAAEADFLEQLEEALHPRALLDDAAYRLVLALVRGHLFVSREERRTADQTHLLELRLTPEGVRRLAGLLYTRLGAL